MIPPHRSAFHEESTHKALEYNLDKVVNLAAAKLKDMINRKQDIVRQNNLLKGQQNVLESDIEHLEKEISEKEAQIVKHEKDFENIEKEIQEMEMEYAETLKLFNEKDETFKCTINSVNIELNSIAIANGVEESSKKAETKKEYENYLQIKFANKDLMEKLYQCRRELYQFELFYKEAADSEIQRIYKTKKGIETINKLYYAEMKEEQPAENNNGENNADNA